MKPRETTWRHLAILAALASCGLGVFAGAEPDKNDAQRPLTPEIAKEWGGAGAGVGWMKDVPPRPTGGYEYWKPFSEKVEPGAMPAFRLSREKEAALAKLPDPGVAFGLDLHCWAGKDAELKKFARLKSLRSLNIGGALLLTDAGMKELAALKNLRGLYLFYAPVTDAGLKELAALKELRALDLSNTQVTDAGLKELAGLKSLQALNLGGTEVTDAGVKALAGLKALKWLNLRGTKVTAAGVTALQEELPAGKAGPFLTGPPTGRALSAIAAEPALAGFIFPFSLESLCRRQAVIFVAEQRTGP